MNLAGAIHIVGTADTKGEELAFIRDLIAARGLPVRIVDVGTRRAVIATDVPASAVAALHPDGADAVLGGDDRGTAVTAMAAAFARWCLANNDQILGMIAVGGGGGTSIGCAGMRELPYGLPKFMVSTLASGDTAPYLGTSDIVMVPSVTDIAGLNRLSRVILSNAAHALAGAVTAETPRSREDRPAIGMTMFGVTTPCVTALGQTLRETFDCLVFHATGVGGRAMERLVAEGVLSGIIDVTLTEIADLLVGGVLPAQDDRLDVIADGKVPWVGSLGAIDMVNFWSFDTVPPAFRGRQFYRHNANVTLMRTTAEENDRIGRWVGDKINRCTGPVRLLVPQGGLSALDIDGGAFRDPAADAALFDALRRTVRQQERLVFLPHHINDPAFATALAQTYLELSETR